MAKNSVALGFVLSATDKASGTVSKSSKLIAGAFKGVGAAIVVMNQGLALARKAYRLLNSTIGDAVKTALKFRTQAVRDEFAAFAKSIVLVKARVGDALIPILQAFMRTLKPVIDGAREWLAANNKLVAAKFGEWVLALASTVANVLVPAVGLAGAGFYGIKAAVQAGLGGIGVGVALALQEIAKLLLQLGKIQQAAGFNDAAAASFKLASSIAGAGTQAAGYFVKQVDAVEETLDAYDRWDAGVTNLRATLNASIEEARTLFTTMNQGAVGGTQSVDEQNEALKKQKDALDKLLAADKRLSAARALARQRAAEAHAEQMEAYQQQIQLAEQLGAALGAAAGSLAAGTLTAKEAVKQLGKAVLAIVGRVIVAYAAESAVIAFKEHLKLGPLIGPIVGVAAASAAFAFASSYLDKFAKGGVVGGAGIRRVVGGTPGKDSVPILAQQGELVLPVPMVNQLAGLLGRPSGAQAARGGRVGGAGAVNLTARFESTVPQSRAQIRKAAREFFQEFRRLEANA